MEIVLKRIAKKNTYTIGRLYILADEDVDRKVITSYNEGLKRVFRDSFDEQKLGADTYFCDTMEPTWRNLLGVELAPQQVDARLGRISGKKAQKMKGHTAIPEGTYRVLITQSPRFRQWLPYLRGHPHPCRQLSRRHPGLHPGGREQAEGHGGKLPHLAPSADEADGGGAAEGGIHLDNYHLMGKKERASPK